MLGIFSDIPGHQLRESEVHAWARAGFTWVVCDGEHSLGEGRYGREQLAMMLRLGITPVQRLHREARSEHGDSLTMGARATMMPYGNTIHLIHATRIGCARGRWRWGEAFEPACHQRDLDQP